MVKVYCFTCQHRSAALKHAGITTSEGLSKHICFQQLSTCPHLSVTLSMVKSDTCKPSCRCASSMCSFRKALVAYARFSMSSRGYPGAPFSGSGRSMYDQMPTLLSTSIESQNFKSCMHKTPCVLVSNAHCVLWQAFFCTAH